MERSLNQNNFEKLRERLHLTNRDFAQRLGVHETQYTKMKKGNYPIGDKTINKIKAAFPEISIDWLLFNEGSMEALTKREEDMLDRVVTKMMKDNKEFIASNYTVDKSKDIGEIQYPLDGDSPFIDIGDDQLIMVVPLVHEYAYAGYLSGYSDPEYVEDLPKHTIIVSKRHRGQYRAFEIVGDSMDDNTKESIPDGAIVTGREIQYHHWTSKFHTHRYKDYVIVHKTEGIIAKRIINHDVTSGIITCHSLNPDKDTYPDFEIHLDDVKQMFNIVNVSITK